MPSQFGYAFSLIVVSVLCGAANANISLSIQAGGSFVENSGVQTLQILASSDASDQVFTLATDLQLSGGSFEAIPGTYGQSGQIGFGNIDLMSDFQRDNGDPSKAYLSLEFDSNETFPSVDQPLATLSFNINGLAPGTYDVNFTYLDALGSSSFLSSFANGQFTITAVPEPASMLPAVILGLTAIISRRKRRKQATSSRQG